MSAPYRILRVAACRAALPGQRCRRAVSGLEEDITNTTLTSTEMSMPSGPWVRTSIFAGNHREVEPRV
eukprot:11786459-Prorocentrum_lima.AAC.1